MLGSRKTKRLGKSGETHGKSKKTEDLPENLAPAVFCAHAFLASRARSLLPFGAAQGATDNEGCGDRTF